MGAEGKRRVWYQLAPDGARLGPSHARPFSGGAWSTKSEFLGERRQDSSRIEKEGRGGSGIYRGFLSGIMFSKFGSGSVQPRQIFQIWLVAVRFEPNFENISRARLVGRCGHFPIRFVTAAIDLCRQTPTAFASRFPSIPLYRVK